MSNVEYGYYNGNKIEAGEGYEIVPPYELQTPDMEYFVSGNWYPIKDAHSDKRCDYHIRERCVFRRKKKQDWLKIGEGTRDIRHPLWAWSGGRIELLSGVSWTNKDLTAMGFTHWIPAVITMTPPCPPATKAELAWEKWRQGQERAHTGWDSVPKSCFFAGYHAAKEEA